MNEEYFRHIKTFAGEEGKFRNFIFDLMVAIWAHIWVISCGIEATLLRRVAKVG